MEYLEVVEESDGEVTEVPSEEDGTVSLETLTTLFPKAMGLKFKNELTGHFRALRVSNGVMKPPEDGWTSQRFYVVYPKGGKRDPSPARNEVSGSYKKSRLSENTDTQDLVVLGIPWKMGEDELRQHFEQYGKVVFLQIKRSGSTGQSRGYGFVRYETIAEQTACLVNKHSIDGRYVDVKIPDSGAKSAPLYNRKIYVKLASQVDPKELKQYFAKYGDITEIFYPAQFKGYAFITYYESGVVHQLYGKHTISGVSAEVGTAAPKRKEEGTNMGQLPMQSASNLWNRNGRHYQGRGSSASGVSNVGGAGYGFGGSSHQSSAGSDPLAAATAAFALLANMAGGGVGFPSNSASGTATSAAPDQQTAPSSYSTSNYDYGY